MHKTGDAFGTKMKGYGRDQMAGSQKSDIDDASGAEYQYDNSTQMSLPKLASKQYD